MHRIMSIFLKEDYKPEPVRTRNKEIIIEPDNQILKQINKGVKHLDEEEKIFLRDNAYMEEAVN